MDRPTGRAKSCVVCRQFKLACDARKTAPDPCSRCVSKNLKCRFDPNFKRILTRKIAQEVADELHTLRAAQNTGTPGQGLVTAQSQLIANGPSPGNTSTTSSYVPSSSSTVNHSNCESDKSAWLDLSDDELVFDQTLYGVMVNSSKILKLFQHFDRYLYPHARFLRPIKSINRLADKRPFLFWTILLLAVERYDVEGSNGLYEQLATVHEMLMPEVTHTAIQHLETVHALLLLCLWPVPKERNAYDPSWNYVGLAIQAALSLDCHNPYQRGGPIAQFKGVIDTPAVEMEPANQAMTWLYCFMISAKLGTLLGLPPPISPPQQSRSLQRAQGLADEVLTVDERVQIRLLEILCSAEIQLDALEDIDSHCSMTQSYEFEIERVKKQFQESWSWNLEAVLQSTRMYLVGMTLTKDASATDEQASSQAFIYRQLALERSMQAASAYVTTMTDLSNQSIQGQRYASGILTFYPKQYFSALMGAATYLFRFLIGYQGATPSQQSHAMTRMTEAHRIFQSFPEHRDAVRACINIEVLVDYIKAGAGMTENTVELLAKHRLGASVVIDATFRCAQQRNRNSKNGSRRPVEEWSMLTHDKAHEGRLPPVPGGKLTSPPSQLPYTLSDPALMSQRQHQVQPDMSALGIWDAYSNDFAIRNEPWLGDDLEFSVFGFSSPRGMQQQQMFPALTEPDAFASCNIYS